MPNSFSPHPFRLRSTLLLFLLPLTIINFANMSNHNETNTTPAPLGLPAPSDAAASSEPNNVIKLDHLGPMVVNSDGTISRIANWQNLSEIEKDRSLRLLAKRNKVRMDNLKADQQPQ